MKCIIKRPFEPIGRIKEIPNTLERLQTIVDGYIETVTVKAGDKKLVIICNEEGKLTRMAPNFRIGSKQIVGTVIVVGVDGEEFTDVPIDLGEWLELLVEWGNTV